MFHMQAPSVQTITQTFEVLGWPRPAVGPVVFGGVQFWASVTLDCDEHSRRVAANEVAHLDRDSLERYLLMRREGGTRTDPHVPLKLEGVLIVGEPPQGALRAASYFSGYAQRAALVPESSITVETAALAAMLDVGLAELTTNGAVRPLSGCGSKVGHASFNSREWHLVETVYYAMRCDETRLAMSVAGV
jgi:hypothetical protein